MRFRLLKPLHGWRSFLGEVAIIVLGVLIALGAQEILQTFNERRLVREARANIRAELGSNLAGMQSRDRIESCIQDRLNAVAAHLDHIRDGGEVTPVTWIGRPQLWLMSTAAIEAAGSTGRLNLLPEIEQLDYAQAYSSMRNFQRSQLDEQNAWAQLRGIAGAKTVSGAQDADVRRALQTARYASWTLHLASLQVQERLAKYRIRFEVPENGSRSVCIPMTTSFADGVRLSGMSDVGEPR